MTQRTHGFDYQCKHAVVVVVVVVVVALHPHPNVIMPETKHTHTLSGLLLCNYRVSAVCNYNIRSRPITQCMHFF